MFDGRRCCVIGCKSKGSKNCPVKFYSFPKTPWLKEKREAWIALMNRKNPDGTPWQPNVRSYLCSAHFVGNEKSEHPMSPSYLPTIFPEAHYGVKPLSKTKIDRITRTQQRDLKLRLARRDAIAEEKRYAAEKKCAEEKKRAQTSLETPRNNPDTTDVEPPELVTIEWANHHEKLVSELWKRFLSNTGVDFSVKWGNQSIKVHRFLLDLFLKPEKLSTGSEKFNSDDNDSLVEFLYKGHVTIPKTRLINLQRVAKESDFQMLVDAVAAATKKKKVPRRGGKSETTFSRFTQTYGISVVSGASVMSTAVQTDRVVFSKADLELFKAANNSQDTVGSTKKRAVGAQSKMETDDESPEGPRPVKQRFKSKNTTESVLKSMMRVRQSDTCAKQCVELDQPRNVQLPAAKMIDSNCDLCQEKKPVGHQHSASSSSTPHQCDVYLVRRDVPCAGDKHEPNVDDAPWYECLVCGRAYPVNRLCTGHQARNRTYQFRCSVCGRAFQKEEEMLDHSAKHKDKPSFKCSKCNISFTGLHPLSVHMRTHSDERPVPCDTCGSIFMTAGHLKIHQRFHSSELLGPSGSIARLASSDQSETGKVAQSVSTQDRNQAGSSVTKNSKVGEPESGAGAGDDVPCYECLVCLQTFLTEEQCTMHVEKHLRRPFFCKVCKASFAKEDMLKTHSLMHSKEALLCSECGKSFSNRGNLSVHVRVTHGGLKAEKNKVCEVCGQKYTTNHRLKVHQRKHTGEKPYKCEFQSCGRAFALRKGLIDHRMTHTNERPFSCHVCEKRFRQRYHLVIHSRTHTGERPYKCHLCDLACTTNGNLRAHLLTHAKGHSSVSRSAKRAAPRFNFNLGGVPPSSSCYGVHGWGPQVK